MPQLHLCRRVIGLSLCLPMGASIVLTGCAAMGEVAYDLQLERERAACNALKDQRDYRMCLDRLRSIESQAHKAQSDD